MSKSSLVLDARALERRPGTMLSIARTASAPAGLGIALARIPEGSPVDLDLTLESVLEGIWVSGSAIVQVEGECARCLEPVRWEDEVELEELFRYPQTDARGAVVEEPGDDDEPMVVDDQVDLEPVIRDQVVLDLPMAPLCSPDCPGLCQACGVRLAENPGHRHDQADPRWAALEALREERPAAD